MDIDNSNPSNHSISSEYSSESPEGVSLSKKCTMGKYDGASPGKSIKVKDCTASVTPSTTATNGADHNLVEEGYDILSAAPSNFTAVYKGTPSNMINTGSGTPRSSYRPSKRESSSSGDKIKSFAASLTESFDRIKPVNPVYQAELKRTEGPDIWMPADVDAIGFPLRKCQLKELQDAAVSGDYNVNDADVSGDSGDTACVFPQGNFEVMNPAWTEYVNDLTLQAAQGLGLGLGAGEVTAELNALWLWTVGCKWCDPSESCPGNRRTLVARMFIFLPSYHGGGNIDEVGASGQDITGTYSTSQFRQSMFCWHKDVNRLRFNYPSYGHRAGLLYDLHVTTGAPPSLNQLRNTRRDAAQALQDAIERHISHLKKMETKKSLPFFLPLTSVNMDNNGCSFPTKDNMSLSDQTKIDVFSEKGMAHTRGFHICTTLAVVGKKECFVGKAREFLKTGPTYTVEKLSSAHGNDHDASLLVMQSFQGSEIEEMQVLNADSFKSAVTHEVVVHHARSENHIFKKSMLCLMIYLKQHE